MSRNSTSRKSSSLMRWLIGAGVLVAALAVGAVALDLGNYGGASLTTVSVSDLDAALAGEATLIDVREPYEFEAGHVAEARLMPLDDTVELASGLPKDDPVYVICRSGNRSLVASQALIDAGFEDVRNVDGGMIAWQQAGLPIER